MRWRAVPALTVGLSACAFLLAAVDTTPGVITPDGEHYAALVNAFGGLPFAPPREPLGYRILPSAIVALTGLDLRTGFLALGFAAVAGSALVLTALLRRYGASPTASLVGLACFLLMPFTARATLHYPVLTDPTAMFLTLALVLAAVSERRATFAVLLVLGALTRETTLVVAPFFWIAAARRGHLRTALLATLPGLAAFGLLRVAPPIALDPSAPGTLTLIRYHVGTFFLDVNDRVPRFLFALPLSLGILAALPALARHRMSRIFSREPEWAYFVAAMIATSLVGGMEPDRYDISLAPVALLAFTVDVRWSRRIVPAVLALQLIAARVLVPWTDPAADASFSVASGDLPTLAWATAVAVASGIVAYAVLRAARREAQVDVADRTAASELPTQPA